jgi:hypothetical protein
MINLSESTEEPRADRMENISARGAADERVIVDAFFHSSESLHSLF